MSHLLAAPLLWLAATILAYEAALRLQRKCGGSVYLNPVLLATAVLIALLTATGTPYASYMGGGGLVYGLLGPATVALAIPLFAQAGRLHSKGLRLVVASGVGAMVACLATVGIAAALGAPQLVLSSIAAKSVTAAVAIGISEQIGGRPSITAAVVVLTGILGAIISRGVLNGARVGDVRRRGLAIGVASHGIGTAYALSVDAEMGAYAGLGMILAALLTGVTLPFLWRLFAQA